MGNNNGETFYRCNTVLWVFLVHLSGMLFMVRIFILLMVMTPALVMAADSGSQIAWTKETLALVKHGNSEKGRRLAETCKACHGERGEGTKSEVLDGETLPAIPALAGQVANYTFKQLRDYFNGDRANASMGSIAG
jgi:cytochrome c553